MMALYIAAAALIGADVLMIACALCAAAKRADEAAERIRREERM